MRLASLVTLACALAATPARADAPNDRDRGFHLASMLTLGGLYLALEIPWRTTFTSERCAWCEPPAFDVAARDVLRWTHHRAAANAAGNVLGFATSPIALSALMIGGAGGSRSLRRTFDDLSPMIESAIVVSLLQSTFKYVTRRQRPIAHYNQNRVANHDDNSSFWSGHTSVVFAETFACGIVAHRRGYAIEPVIWATGLTLGAATSYLRIAADMHYATDVLAAIAVGTAVGIAVPTLFHSDVTATPATVAKVLSIGGTF